MNNNDTNNFLFKHTAAIHIVNKISLIERKIINALFKNYTKKKNNSIINECSINIKELFLMIGWDNNDYRPLKKSLDNLVNTVVNFNIFDVDKKNKWGASAMLSHYEVEEGSGMCTYILSPLVTRMLDNPNIYARLNLMIQSKFGSKYTSILWEFLVEKLKSNDNLTVKGVSINDLKTLFGILDIKSYQDFKYFSRFVLKPSIDELNQVSDINVEYNLVRERKMVTKIDFTISKKDIFKNNKEEQQFVTDNNILTANFIEDELMNYGFSKNQTQNFIKEYSLDRIYENIKYYEYILQKGHEIKAPVAYLAKAIKDDYRLNNNSNNIDIDVKIDKNASIFKYPDVANKLRQELGENVFNSWIIPCKFELMNNELFVTSPSKFSMNWIVSKYRKSIEYNFNICCGREIKVNFFVQPKELESV